MLWIISGCITSRGFTLGKDARGHLPWNTLYVRFTSDLLRTNEDGCDLHEKSSERAPAAGSHSVPCVLEGGWVGSGRPPWWQPSFQGEQQRQLSGSQSRFGRKTCWMNWSGQPCSAKSELILQDLASAFMFWSKEQPKPVQGIVITHHAQQKGASAVLPFQGQRQGCCLGHAGSARTGTKFLRI